MRGARHLGVFLLCVLLSWGVHCTQSEGHHVWRLLVTRITQGEGIPEFTFIAMVDDLETGYFSSNKHKIILIQDWVMDALGSEFLKMKTRDFRDYQQRSKRVLEICMERYNHTSGVHTLQVYVSCEVHGDTGIEGLFQFVYDGQVVLAFDGERDMWVAAVTEMIPLKQYIDIDKGWRAFVKYYQQTECIETLKKHIQHGKHILEQQVPPEVRVLTHQSTDGTVIHRCHVSGFYPRDIDVTWVKDGQVTLMETLSSGILPNHDKTYQIQKTLEIVPKDGHTYTCVVNHSSLQTRIIKTASAPDGYWILGLLAAGIMVLLILCVGSAGVLKKKQNLCTALSQYMPANRINGEET